ncbi:glutaredoxin family protein [Nakamurella antarctica]|uniref:Glutaredoxin family protein n=1 Tax=Nakamurella antarctica TaxID=1902245 RepID=A0A3G9A022_9ACTN|nr:glutaredoxin family protein [Nakamurella antarctica]AZI59596.1 glutaredoxin family protein [Nakamurella antarctica]
MIVTLITRKDCHLCTEAAQVLSRVAAEVGIGWNEVDVDSDAEMRGEYGDQVPVVLIDGQMHSYFRLDEGRLRRALAD